MLRVGHIFVHTLGTSTVEPCKGRITHVYESKEGFHANDPALSPWLALPALSQVSIHISLFHSSAHVRQCASNCSRWVFKRSIKTKPMYGDVFGNRDPAAETQWVGIESGSQTPTDTHTTTHHVHRWQPVFEQERQTARYGAWL